MKFHPDPTNPKEMICDDCFKALQEVNEDWLDEDNLANGDELAEWFWGDEDEDTEDDTDED